MQCCRVVYFAEAYQPFVCGLTHLISRPPAQIARFEFEPLTLLTVCPPRHQLSYELRPLQHLREQQWSDLLNTSNQVRWQCFPFHVQFPVFVTRLDWKNLCYSASNHMHVLCVHTCRVCVCQPSLCGVFFLFFWGGGKVVRGRVGHGVLVLHLMGFSVVHLCSCNVEISVPCVFLHDSLGTFQIITQVFHTLQDMAGGATLSDTSLGRTIESLLSTATTHSTQLLHLLGGSRSSNGSLFSVGTCYR